MDNQINRFETAGHTSDATISPESCIGKTARYRKDNEREIKTGEVLAVKKFTNIAGDIETDFKMANGDIVNAAACYFEIL